MTERPSAPRLGPLKATSIYDQLTDEWRSLQRRSMWRASFARIAATPPLDRFNDADELVARFHGNDRDDEDELLGSLLDRRPDSTAMRVLLQAFVPTMRAISRSLGRTTTTGRHEVEAITVAAAWERLATFPLDRRPRSIAANIALDVRKHCRRSVGALEVGIDLDAPSVSAATVSAEEDLVRATTAAVHRGTITRDDASMFLAHEIANTPAVVLARGCGLSTRLALRRVSTTALRVLDELS